MTAGQVLHSTAHNHSNTHRRNQTARHALQHTNTRTMQEQQNERVEAFAFTTPNSHPLGAGRRKVELYRWALQTEISGRARDDLNDCARGTMSAPLTQTHTHTHTHTPVTNPRIVGLAETDEQQQLRRRPTMKAKERNSASARQTGKERTPLKVAMASGADKREIERETKQALTQLQIFHANARTFPVHGRPSFFFSQRERSRVFVCVRVPPSPSVCVCRCV